MQSGACYEATAWSLRDSSKASGAHSFWTNDSPMECIVDECGRLHKEQQKETGQKLFLLIFAKDYEVNKDKDLFAYSIIFFLVHYFNV